MAHQVTQSIIVNRGTPEVYQLWADIENFPRFMQHIKSIRKTGEHPSTGWGKAPWAF